MKGLLTTIEAAEHLGLTPARIRQMISEGVIKGSEKVGRDNLIPAKEIERLSKIERKPGRPAKGDKSI